MKKLILCSFALALAIDVYFQTSGKNDESLFSSDVEALASGEGGQYDYPDGYAYTTICGVQISKGKKCKVEIITCQGGGNGCNTKGCPAHKS